MLNKKLCVVLFAFLILYDGVQGKKSRRNKRPPQDEGDHTPQPSGVSYSTFGFNDVGTYEGFVPSSPDYAKFLSGTNQEFSPKDQAPVFSTSPDSSGPNYDSSLYTEHTFTVNNGDDGSQSSMIQYPHSSIGVFSTSNFDRNNNQHRNNAGDEVGGSHTSEFDAPIYGTKLSSRNKIRPEHQYNHTDFPDASNSENDMKSFNINNDKPNYDHRQSQYRDTNSNFQNTPNFSSSSSADLNKPITSDSQNSLAFQKVVDFTNIKQQFPTELDTSRLPPPAPIPDLYENNEPNNNMFMSSYNFDGNHNFKQLNYPASKYKEFYGEQFNNDDTTEKKLIKSNNVKDELYKFDGYTSAKENSLTANYDAENKKKMKNNHWKSGNHWLNKWKDSPSPAKGYEYSTNYSSMSFKYDADDQKMSKPLGNNIDELIPASSNIDFSKYQFPQNDYSRFKKMPEYKVHEDEDEFSNFPSIRDTFKHNNYEYNQHKHLFSTPPTTTHWRNYFKPAYTSSLKNYHESNKYKENFDDDVVNIPRRPNKLNYEKPFESKYEWPQNNRKPNKNRPWKDWSKEVPSTRFKSEEDLLDLRNQDTSHPSYLPSYQSSNYLSEDIDYRKLVEKWRQSYLKSKYKDSVRDYESYGTETKPMHVPVPKPYPIEVPHPVIVPVPQPYPVRVPIAKPVAIPIFRELKIPIEKPMPYLVYKEVPYPVEKLVPVPVEKEVQVPVEKPYPVHIPHIRPVFHHTKSRDHYDSDHRDDDDYFPRPAESSKKHFQYKKKVPYGSRNRSRRPSRTSYHDRNRRRWPDRRYPIEINDEHPRIRPMERHPPSPFKRRDTEVTRFEVDPHIQCKQLGRC